MLGSGAGKAIGRFANKCAKYWQVTSQRRQQHLGSIRQSRNIGVGGYSLLAIPLATFALGTWQVQRRKWKLQLIDELSRKTELPPVDLPESLSELSSMEYQRVRVVGTFDHAREVYVSPRSLIQPGDGEKQSGGLLSSASQTGALVITPFKLADRDVSILVNRGWVPRAKTAPESRAQGQIEGEVQLTGIVRRPEKRPPLGPKEGHSGTFWHYKDIEGMARFRDVAPVLIDADSASTVTGGPVGGQTKVTLRNEHFSYILTWYSLSAATTFMWYSKYVRGKTLM
uniref:SURF1-like protein n=1 Tax=Ixodes ricinus TaxID=34613 RepID=A0A147BHD8_IXORI